jgi:agmatinase
MALMKYLGALPDTARGEAAIFGVPFDGTASFRAGARFGPGAIREGSQSLETYSPFLDRDLDSLDYIDLGDIEVPPGSAKRTVEMVKDKTREIYKRDMKPMVFGGEHTISLGSLCAALEKYPDLILLQLDAHTDLREEYLGESLSHATVIRRAMDHLPKERIVRFGVRAGTREELVDSGLALPLGFEGGQRDIERVIHKLPENTPIYVTVDLDVFDPSLMPGVGNPEPLGLTYREFIQMVRVLVRRNVIGCDVVELAPHYDASGVSAVVAASVVRELMICMGGE